VRRDKFAAPMSEQRALLLTDVVDSTQLAERLGDAAAAELNAAHDRVARDLLRTWRGWEIDKTDGMLMLFDAAEDALGFAIAYHAALATLPVPLQARAGLHVGAVMLRNNPPEDVARGAKPLEVEGIAKPIAARVMSLAIGGQTLLTAAARAALGATVLRVQSHGFWRVKGIAEPVELFEAGDDGAPFTPPPDNAKLYRVVKDGDQWLPVRHMRHSLPAERDAFVGRRDALAELAARFERGARLVSVLGIGGTGKTRLATRFGWTWLGDFPGGVWFCDLVQARNVDGLVRAVAQGLDVQLGAEDPVIQLGRVIAGRDACLVILDNFEQVTRHAAETLGLWLDRAPAARFLITTREVLGLPGEEALALPPLAAKDGEALFLRRAAAAHSGFRPGDHDRAVIRKLVDLLDGLPLAIELAAARVRLLPPDALLARMDQRFRLLVAAGGRHDRQATLRAAFDWSWDLLSDAERSGLAQLSVFEGGFTLHAAEAVIDLSACAGTHWAVDVLQSLVDKSLVRRVGEERFDLLVSVQDYVAEHLSTERRFPGSGADTRVAAQRRHGICFAESSTSPQAADARADLQNRIVACERAVLRGECGLAVELLSRSWDGLQLQGPYHTAAAMAQRVLEDVVLTAAQRARVQLIAGQALRQGGRDRQAREHVESALSGSRDADDRRTEAESLRLLGDIDTFRDGELARSHFDAAMAIARELADPSIEADVQTGLAILAQIAGQTGEAMTHFDAACALARLGHDRPREGKILGNKALLYGDLGLMEEARAHLVSALAIARETGNRRVEGNALCNLGLLSQLLDDSSSAARYLQESLQVARETGNANLECLVLCNLGIVGESLKDLDSALGHFESSVSMARMLGDSYLEGQCLGYLGRLHARSGRHSDAARCLDIARTMMEASQDRLGLALLHCARAEAAYLSGDLEAATAALEAAEKIDRIIGAAQTSEIGLALTRARRLVTIAIADQRSKSQ
jgi:predicted ATPase/class 3 adenylate cyclase